MANRLIESPITVGDSKVGKNSTSVVVGDFVTYSSGTYTPATGTAVIAGVSNQTKTYASNNETVAKEVLSITKANETLLVQSEISGGTITVADEGKYYSLVDGNTVDGTTESATTGTLQLVKYVSAILGVFKIVNK